MPINELSSPRSPLPTSHPPHPSTDFQLRSEEVQEILTRVPNWMIRWGTVVIAVVLFLLLFSTWFIKYPDIVSAPIVITTNIPPEKVLAKTSGKIEAILVQDKTIVNENTALAVIQNSADYKEVLSLSQELQAHPDLSKGKEMSNMINNFRTANLGEIQQAFSLFEKDCMAHDLNQELQPYQVQANAQSSESVEISARLNILQQQKSLNESELQLQKNDVNRYETLFNKGIISAQDYDNKKLGYLQAEKNYRSLLSSISQLKSSLIDNSRNSKSTTISGTKESVTLESSQIQSFYNLKKVIKDWELAYVLKSSVAGKVSFLQIWTANQTITAGESVFAIIPTLEKGYIGKLKALALNSGKIKVGQQVNIRLADFPDSEYGMLQGTIQNISLTPDKDGNVLMDVALPQKLKTSYHKTIAFQQEMSGSADIITEDLRLIERLLYQFRNVFKR
jgi:multidrug efflux pump subunit AcrA (membrane-fusion protein)